VLGIGKHEMPDSVVELSIRISNSSERNWNR